MWAFQNGNWNFLPMSIGTADAPNRLVFASMTYLPGGNLIMFGGYELGVGSLSSTTWELAGTTLASLTWTRLSTGPSARWGASLAYDFADGYVVLFGGCASNPPVNFSACSSLLGDTWKFNSGWTSLGSHGPSSRMMASISSNQGPVVPILLLGGWNMGPLSDEWQFSSGAWTSVGTVPFAGRWGAMLAYDVVDNSMILFGGVSYGPHGVTETFNDTWVKVGSTWLPAGEGPFPKSPRGYGNLVFDPNAGGDGWLLQFGGTNSATWQTFGETWYFTEATGWVEISPWV